MPVFYDQTTHLLDQAPNVTAQDAAEQDWMPLGVFAVTPDGTQRVQFDGATCGDEGWRNCRHRL